MKVTIYSWSTSGDSLHSGQPQVEGSGMGDDPNEAVQNHNEGSGRIETDSPETHNPDGPPEQTPSPSMAKGGLSGTDEDSSEQPGRNLAEPDPNPAALTLTDHEVKFIQVLAPMVSTPRAAKRLVNIYRMIRSTQTVGSPSSFLNVSDGSGDYQAVLQLLAIVSGFPQFAASTFTALLEAEPGTTWSAFLHSLPGSAVPGRGTVNGE